MISQTAEYALRAMVWLAEYYKKPQTTEQIASGITPYVVGDEDAQVEGYAQKYKWDAPRMPESTELYFFEWLVDRQVETLRRMETAVF